MNRKGHMMTSGIATIAIVVIIMARSFDPWLLLKAPLMLFLGFMGPDLDKSIRLRHRHGITHSILIPLLFMVSFWGPNSTSLLMLPWCVHLIADLYQSPGKRPTGNYLISLGRRRLPVRYTRLWLALNGIGGIVLSIVLEL